MRPPCSSTKRSHCTKKPPEPQHGIVDAALVGLEHLDDERDDGFRRVVLPALFAFRDGELAEEVFVNVAEDVLGVERVVMEGDGGDQVDQLPSLRRVDWQRA